MRAKDAHQRSIELFCADAHKLNLAHVFPVQSSNTKVMDEFPEGLIHWKSERVNEFRNSLVHVFIHEC